MSTLDDFNRFEFERARSKYNRCQYADMTTDNWVALVEGYKAQAEEARAAASDGQDWAHDE